MHIPVKKLKNGFEMPVYGLGTWQMGGRSERNPHNNDSADIAAIKAAIDQGITHIDTAEAYAAGYAEELVAKAIEGYDRKSLLLVSKVYSVTTSYDDVVSACRNSLKRLKTDYLDLFLLHRYPTSPLSEVMRAMDTLIDQGLIKNIGVSNFNVKQMQDAQNLTKNKIVANQIHLNLKYREAESKGVLRYCQENDIMFIAWRPLQKGEILNAEIVKEIAEKYSKTPAQIALNWLISQKNVVTLSKTTNLSHLKENLGAIDWEMDEADVEKLRNEFPDQEFVSNSVPLA